MRDQLESNKLKNTRNPNNVARTWLTRSKPPNERQCSNAGWW